MQSSTLVTLQKLITTKTIREIWRGMKESIWSLRWS